MKYQIYPSAQEATLACFQLFKDQLALKADSCFGLATGSTPEGLYQLLRKSDLNFSQATAINLDEYEGLDSENPNSYAKFMREQLFNAKTFKATFIPNGMAKDPKAETARYDQLLSEHPVDLQLLGLGNNGHIGFNEPGSSFDGKTQLVDLTPSTIAANQRFFASYEDVPKHAYSMGIASILAAKRIVLMAFGSHKAEAVKAMIEGPVTEDVPASALQNHRNAIILLDTKAAALLS